MTLTKQVACACIGFLAILGCTGELEDPSEGAANTLEASGGGGSRPGSTQVINWNLNTAEAIRVGATNNLVQSRVYTMVHVAIHDAVNAADREYRGYAFTGRVSGANPEAAAASAAHDVLVHLYPSQQATIDGWLTTALAGINASSSMKQKGVQAGQQAAAAIVARRLNDGWNATLAYTPGTDPGDWQPTPPAFGPAAFPHWQNVTPWAMSRKDQFRLPPPPSLTSGDYTDDFNEVKDVGSATSTSRTADEAHRVDFFFEGHQITLNILGRIIAPQKGWDLWKTARFFAHLNMAISDAYIGGFDAKYAYEFWRPVTAIRAGDTDGNDATVGDPAWSPFRNTPSHPDYPSTHSVSGGAGEEVILRTLNFRDSFNATFTTTSAQPAGSTRTYTSVRQFAADNMNSRVHAGIHFRSACELGREMGQDIGEHVFRNTLRDAD